MYNNGNGINTNYIEYDGIKYRNPHAAFFLLRSSSNYDDTKTRMTGGVNGYGAKLTAIFSKRFIIKTLYIDG